MAFPTLNTILNNAPLIIQGATKLIELIRDREKKTDENNDNSPTTLEGLKGEIEKIDKRLDDNQESDIEQIKLIEALAKQNETLANSLNKTVTRLNMLLFVSVIALLLALFALFNAVK